MWKRRAKSCSKVASSKEDAIVHYSSSFPHDSYRSLLPSFVCLICFDFGPPIQQNFQAYACCLSRVRTLLKLVATWRHQLWFRCYCGVVALCSSENVIKTPYTPLTQNLTFSFTC